MTQDIADIAVRGPVRVVVDSDGRCADLGPEFTRVQGRDLRRVAQLAAAARRDSPDADVLVDIDVVLDHSAAAARQRWDTEGGPCSPETLTYIGTPEGLAGLVADIHALGMCDGAVLRALLPGVAELIRVRVLPMLATLAPAITAGPISWR
ncbi:hypothetical protein [Mycolicibacterium sp.]|uniref:hypothetical protein n=1 Tax=Mycolicibacterium sp. TaxID=2320850 RepID=UPI003D0D9619